MTAKIPPAIFLAAMTAAASASGFSAAQLRETAGAPAAPETPAPAILPGPEAGVPAALSGRCAPPAPSEPVIYQSDFHWNYSLPEMKARFAEMYASPKRLDKRAYWDEKAGSLVLPSPYGDRPVKIGMPLVSALRRHIEMALEKGYADAVFFPDMGHSHLLIPQALWDSKYDKYPASEQARMYEDMLADPAVHIFYHTAEQLKTLQDGQPINDEALLFRRANRNISGPIRPGSGLTVYQNPESAANTVHEVPGFRWWGAGFNFSAQKDGCFPYNFREQTYYFDISLQDLPPDPSAGGGDW